MTSQTSSTGGTEQHPHSKVDCMDCGLDFDFDLPRELVEAAHRRDVVIFAGAGISTEVPAAHPVTIYDSVIKQLNRDDFTSFPEAMQAYQDKFDKSALVQMIKRKFDYIDGFRTLRWHARKFHRELATMPYLRDIVTTNWDVHFEEECDATPFVYGDDIALWKMSDRKVLKIHGSISNPGSLVATEEDYQRRLEELNTKVLGTFLKNFLATRTVVFVGYSLRDWNFRRLYGTLLEDMKDYAPRAYFVSPFGIDTEDEKRFRLRVLKTSGVKFLQELKYANYGSCFIRDNSYGRVMKYLQDIAEADQFAKSFAHKENPAIIYTWAFHDGARDACNRILIRRSSGEYSSRRFIWKRIETYERLAEEAREQERFRDEAYIYGYLTPLMIMVDDDQARWVESGGGILESASRYFVYGMRRQDGNLQTREDFIRALQLSRRRAPRERAIAREIANGLEEGMVLEHEPFLPGAPTENDPIPDEHSDEY
ncbi:hypothetical protein FZI85_28310 [Mycobacterium sp. CBMA293]|nr:hypothetical protein [Mycolicibacterium sp. CBMA 360]MUL60333.1 hypothetical protein [Mycolicibacterium sp. CBMA 335]MUL71455.1 hypothetical protein [Mycolicibacterium sp. CBMA 311]MUL97071.1 hypothetical protein [Mycolicibacterium sp. CBMA 230]MUM08440.1 hypothetical protein [Mycolicibacterium sp. CBMA 213]MUM14907.1 hypothetical protein [Mycolicibacterium sp. CBMA 293]